jgi:hypothetical protein
MQSAHGTDMTQLSPEAVGDLRSLLNQDHRRLDCLFERLNAAFAADVHADLSALWTAFEGGLTTHIELEERFVLPKFAEIAPGEAARLAREHAEIRVQLLQLGVALDLGLARAHIVHEFLSVLELHATREDALMHRWAETHVVGPTRDTLLTALLRVMRKGVGMTPRQLEPKSS